MLGDSVVGVKHCIDPRGGKIAPATWGLVAAGAACLLASAIAFHDRLACVGETTAAANPVGVGNRVVAVTTALGADGPVALDAVMRNLYAVSAASPVLL